MRTMWFIFSIVAVVVAAGCRTPSLSEETSQSTPEEQEVVEESPSPDIVEGIGTIRYLDLEGGFFGLVGEDGTQYQPLNLAEAYREDGLRVRFRVRKREDVMTIRMWGQPVDILNLERIEEE